MWTIDCAKMTSEDIAEFMAMTAATVFDEPTSNRVMGDVGLDHRAQDVSPDDVAWLISTLRMTSPNEDAGL